MTTSDIAWSLLFVVIFLPLTIACLIAAFGLVGPYVAPDVGSPSAIMKLLGTVTVGVTMLLSALLSVLLFGLITRLFLSPASYERWRQQLENGRPRASPLITASAKLMFRMIRPKQVKNAL